MKNIKGGKVKIKIPLIKSIEDIRDKIVENLKQEAASFMKGVPSSEIVTLGEGTSTGSILKRSLKMNVPFVKGKAIADQIVCVDIPGQNARIGTVYFINPFERKAPLPHEFGAIIDGKIPSSWILERSWGFGKHASAIGCEERRWALAKLLHVKLMNGEEYRFSILGKGSKPKEFCEAFLRIKGGV